MSSVLQKSLTNYKEQVKYVLAGADFQYMKVYTYHIVIAVNNYLIKVINVRIKKYVKNVQKNTTPKTTKKNEMHYNKCS